MKMTYKRTLLEYDKIEIFEGIDADGLGYLGLLVDCTKNKDIYCVIPINREMLAKFEKGEVELLYLFVNRQNRLWFLAEVTDLADEPIELKIQENASIDKKYIPKSGFYLLPANEANHHSKVDDSARRDRSKLRDNLIFFVLGLVAAIAITALLLALRGQSGDVLHAPPPQKPEIQNIVCESSFVGDEKQELPIVNISWDTIRSATEYKVSRKPVEIGIEKYSYLNESTTKTNSFSENIELGEYVYKIQAFGLDGLLDEKEFVWHHHLRVRVKKDVNVRISPLIDTGNKYIDSEGTETVAYPNKTGITCYGPVINKNDSDITWWNIVWNKEESSKDPFSTIGWSARNDDSDIFLEFENVKGKPLEYEKEPLEYKKNQQ